MKASNGAVLERAKPIAETAGMATRKMAGSAADFLKGFAYDPNPSRTKFKLVAKAAAPAIFAGVIIGRLMRRGS